LRVSSNPFQIYLIGQNNIRENFRTLTFFIISYFSSLLSNIVLTDNVIGRWFVSENSTVPF